MSRRQRLRAALRAIRANLPPLRGLLPLVACLVVWQIAQGGPSPYFPAPTEWWKAALQLASRGDLFPALASTIVSFAGGLVLAIAIGVTAGLVIGVSPLAARALGPLLEFLRGIPPPATVPIAALLIGYNETMKLTVVVLAAVWPILLNTTSAVLHIDPVLVDVARSFRLGPVARARRIIVPSIVPSLLLGIRVAIPLAIIVALLVEMLTSLPGVGALMIRSQRNFQSGEAYALLVLVGLFGFIVNDAFAAIEALVLRRWPPRAGTTET